MAFGEQPSNLNYPQATAPPKQVTLAERCMQHEQRILELEQKVAAIEKGCNELCQRLADQVGLVF